jgi:hypothetical protein
MGIALLAYNHVGHAICQSIDLNDAISQADSVYVATIIRSEITQKLENLREDVRLQRFTRIEHTVELEFSLKGNPQLHGAVFSNWQYRDPTKRTFGRSSERIRLIPGDSILVVANDEGPTFLSTCSPSRLWDAKTSETVRMAFPGVMD